MINACWHTDTLPPKSAAHEHTVQPRPQAAFRVASRRLCKRKRQARPVSAAATVTEAPTRPADNGINQVVREGHYEQPLVEHQVVLPAAIPVRQALRCRTMRRFVQLLYTTLSAVQASKADEEQPLIADTLQLFNTETTADVSVIGCGPAGLALASQLAKQGLAVCLIGALQAAFVPSMLSGRTLQPTTSNHRFQTCRQ